MHRRAGILTCGLMTALVVVAVGNSAFAQGDKFGPGSAGPDGFDFPDLKSPLGGGLGIGAEAEHVTVSAEIAPGAGGEPPQLVITANVTPGWHFYSITQKPGGPIRSEIKLAEGQPVRLLGPFSADSPPEIKHFDFWEGLDVEEHHKTVTWSAPIEILPPAKLTDVAIRGEVVGQVCKESCVDFKVPFEAQARVVESREAVPIQVGSVSIKGQIDRLTAKPGETVQLTLSVTPAKNWHVYGLADAPPKGLTGARPTLIAIFQRGDLRFGRPTPNKPVSQKSAGGESYFLGPVTFAVPVDVPESAAPGPRTIGGVMGFQTCEEGKSCEMPTAVRFHGTLTVGQTSQPGTTPLELAAASYKDAASAVVSNIWDNPGKKKAGAEKAADGGDWISKLTWPAIFAVAFAAGFILNFMPCVLPVIGLKVMSFVQQAGESRQRIFALNVWFSLGLMSVFWALATIPAVVTLFDSNRSFGWGEQFSLPWFNIVLTSVVFAFSLSFLGVWEIPIPGFVGRSSANEVAEREGATGAFVKGILATILATPCVGPLLVPATAWAFKQPMWLTYVTFTFIGLGMACPYLAIGAYPRLMNLLPKPGMWMETFKHVMGFILIGTVVWLFSSLHADYHVKTLALLTAIAFACWVIGRVPLTASSSLKFQSWLWGIGTMVYVATVCFVDGPRVVPIATIVAAVGVAAWILHQIPEAAGVGRRVWGWVGAALVMVAAAAVAYLAVQTAELPWEPFSRATLNDLRSSGHTVLVDFTADW